MGRTILIPLIFLCLSTQAQENLVPNGSFEQFSDCPMNPGNWTAVSWNTPTFTPDYFNVCAQNNGEFSVSIPQNYLGFQPPSEGEAYAGITPFNKNLPEAREYLVAELSSEMIASWRYEIKFFVSPSERAQYAVSTLGAALTSEPPEVVSIATPNGMIDAVPQIMPDERIPITDTAKWILICDTVWATGGEKYITIGNFHLDGDSDTLRFNPNQPPLGNWPSTFAYYYIDDVSVVALDSVPSGVGIDEVGREYGFKVYPNPSNGILTIEYSLGLTDVGTAQLFDLSGRCVHHSTLIADANLTKLGLSHVSSGLYLLRIAVNGDTKLSEQISIVNP